MVDMSQFIAARSDQLNADDLMDSPCTITITKVTASPDAAEQPVSIHYEGDDGKPFKPCKTVRRIMVGVWGKDASQYAGRSMTLYRDPAVAFGGMQVGGIRVSHMSHIDDKKTVALQVTRGRKAPFTVQPLKSAPQQQPAPQQSQQQTDDQPAKWANGYIDMLLTFTTLAELQAFVSQYAAKLEKLQEQRPDLHEKVTTALATRSADLAPATSSFDDDDLTTAADKAAPVAGDINQQNADRIIAEINDPATNAVMDVDAIVAREHLDISMMPDDQAVRVEIAADKRRNAIKAEQEAAKAKEAAGAD